MTDVLLHDLSQRLQSLFEDEQDFEAGFALGRHILRWYPRHLATYRRFGLGALAADMYTDAADLLRRFLSSHPEHAAAWAGLRQAATALGLDDEAYLAKQYEQDLAAKTPGRGANVMVWAADAMSKGNWPQAARYYTRAYKESPQRMDAVLGLAMSLHQTAQFEDCKRISQMALDQLPYCLKAHWLMIRCAYETEDDAIDVRFHLRVARSLDPDDVYLWQWFGEPDDPPPTPTATLPDWDGSRS